MREELNPNAESMAPRRNAPVQPSDGIDVLELFFVLVAHWWQIALSVVVCAAMFFAYTYFNVAPTYRATAKMFLVSSSSESTLSIVSELQLGSSIKPDYQELMKSRPLLENVIRKLDLPYSTGHLASMISVANPTDTHILWVTATSTYPAEAADIANEVVNQSRDYLSDIMKIDPPSFYEPALVPTAKAGPNYTRSMMTGAAIGAVASAGFFILLFLLDDRMETPDDVTKYLGITPLATIPEADSMPKKKKKKSASKHDGKKKDNKTDGGAF